MAALILDLLASSASKLGVLGRRISLDTPGVMATVPMLRGVWGKALHHVDAEAYGSVFVGLGAPNERTPLYVLRPATPDPEDAPALDWLLFGAALSFDAILLRAWDIASGLGLGASRNPFRIRRFRDLSPVGLSSRLDHQPWHLARAVSGTGSDMAPLRVMCVAPLRLIRSGRLISEPGLPDIALAAARRVAALGDWRLSREQASLILAEAQRVRPGVWSGSPLSVVRYSARQDADIEMRGVVGELRLPQGAGLLLPLLRCAEWTHIGKGTTIGMGRIVLGLDE